MSVRLFVLFGYMPLSLVRPTDKRTLLRSLLRATATLALMIKPVFQKSRTLFPCRCAGPAPGRPPPTPADPRWPRRAGGAVPRGRVVDRDAVDGDQRLILT